MYGRARMSADQLNAFESDRKINEARALTVRVGLANSGEAFSLLSQWQGSYQGRARSPNTHAVKEPGK